MRKLIWIAGTVALLWSALWVVGTIVIRDQITNWITTQRAQGNDVYASGIGVGGYPLRFNISLAGPRWADPDDTTRVSAGAIALGFPAWWPGHASFSLPKNQISVLHKGLLTSLYAEAAVVTLRIRPGTALELQSLRFDSGRWDAQADSQRIFEGASLNAAFHQSTEDPTRYDIAFDASDFALGDVPREYLAIPQDWPYALSAFEGKGALTFATPLDKNALEGSPPVLRAVELADSRVTWDDVDIRASGAVDIGTDGLPEGEVNLFVGNWRRVFQIAQSSDPGIPAQAELMLNALANIGGDPDTLDVTLQFQDGRMALSGIDLGPAPRLN